MRDCRREARALSVLAGGISRAGRLRYDLRLTPPVSQVSTAAGFTLIELVITVAIVAILASGLIPLTQLAAQRSKEQELRSSLREIRTAIDAYKKAIDDSRIEKKADQTGFPPKLDVLVEGVKDMKTPDGTKIYFLRRIPRDPFFEDSTVARPRPGACAVTPARRRSQGRRGCFRRVLAIGQGWAQRRAI